jgi:hypothetical protein
MLVSLFTPFFLAWRAAALATLAFFAGQLLSGPTHWSDQNIGYGLGWLIVFGVVGIMAIMLTLRAAIWALLSSRGLGPAWRRWVDLVTLGLVGVVAGVWAAIGAAYALGGGPWGRGLDLGLGLVAIAIGALGLLAWPGRKPAVMIMAAFAGIAAVGSAQPSRILAQGAALDDGRPWCVAIAKIRAPAVAPGQLGFFSMVKGGAAPHLVRIIGEGDGVETAHWSIRQQRFNKGFADFFPQLCRPRRAFAEALRAGRTDMSPATP